MNSQRWKHTLVNWVNCLDLNNGCSINDLSDPTVSHLLLSLVNLLTGKNSSASAGCELQIVASFLTDEYPSFDINYNNLKSSEKEVYSTEIAYIVSLLMHYSCICKRNILIMEKMCSTKDSKYELSIRTFLENFETETDITRHCLASAIPNESDLSVEFGMVLETFEFDNDLSKKSPNLDDCSTQIFAHKQLETAYNKIKHLEDLVASEKYNAACLEEEVKKKDDLINNLSSEISHLKQPKLLIECSDNDELNSPNIPEDANKENKKLERHAEILKRKLKKEYDVLLKSKIAEIIEQTKQQLKSLEKENKTLQGTVHCLEAAKLQLQNEVTDKEKEIVLLGEENSELNRHIKETKILTQQVPTEIELQADKQEVHIAESLSFIVDIQLQDEKNKNAKLEEEIKIIMEKLTAALETIEILQLQAEIEKTNMQKEYSDELNCKIADLTEDFKQKLDSAEFQYSSLQERVSLLSKIDEQVIFLREENVELNLMLKTLTDNLQDEKVRNLKLQEEMNIIVLQSEERLKTVETLKVQAALKKNELLKEYESTLKCKIVEISEEFQQQLMSAEVKNSSLNERISLLESENEMLQNKISDIDKEVILLKEENVKLLELKTLSDLHNVEISDKLENKNVIIYKLQEELNISAVDLKESSEIIDSLKIQTAVLTEKLQKTHEDELNCKIAEISKDFQQKLYYAALKTRALQQRILSTFQNKLCDRDIEVTLLKEEIVELGFDIKRLNDLNMEHAVIWQENARLREEIKIAEMKIKDATAKIISLQTQLNMERFDKLYFKKLQEKRDAMALDYIKQEIYRLNWFPKYQNRSDKEIKKLMAQAKIKLETIGNVAVIKCKRLKKCDDLTKLKPLDVQTSSLQHKIYYPKTEKENSKQSRSSEDKYRPTDELNLLSAANEEKVEVILSNGWNGIDVQDRVIRFNNNALEGSDIDPDDSSEDFDSSAELQQEKEVTDSMLKDEPNDFDKIFHSFKAKWIPHALVVFLLIFYLHFYTDIKLYEITIEGPIPV